MRVLVRLLAILLGVALFLFLLGTGLILLLPVAFLLMLIYESIWGDLSSGSENT